MFSFLFIRSFVVLLGNILLNKDKTRIKLADFGLARELSTDMTSEAGTYRWMAPEVHIKFSSPMFYSGFVIQTLTHTLLPPNKTDIVH